MSARHARSVRMPLMERTICEECEHFHREILGKPWRDSKGLQQPAKCWCCADDLKRARGFRESA